MFKVLQWEGLRQGDIKMNQGYLVPENNEALKDEWGLLTGHNRNHLVEAPMDQIRDHVSIKI